MSNLNAYPLVSVVMCTYNDERYIAETIDSILRQTFTDFEFIIWDDGSTDGSRQIIHSYTDERIRYFYHENTGLGKALNLACQQAGGKYIARIDADDICIPSRLEKQVQYMERHPKCVLLSSSCYYIDENGTIYGRSLNCTWNSVIKKTLKVGSATIHPAAMFRTEVYRQTSGYLSLRNAQDRILWSKMARFGKFANLSDALIKYRLLSTSLSHTIDDTPYSKLLEDLRRKMIDNDVVSQNDIDTYNAIYLKAKSSKTKTGELQYRYRVKIEERMHQMLSPITGEIFAAKILIFIKNIYCFILR